MHYENSKTYRLRHIAVLRTQPPFLPEHCQNHPCTVIGTLYDTGCGFPAFQMEGNTSVKAELIEIPIADWAAVDRLECYPRLYDCQLISCTLADGTTDTGWIYIMNNLPPMATVIKGGEWKGYRHG